MASDKLLPMDAVIGVGFGEAHLSKDGEVVWSECDASVTGWDDLMGVSEAEELAQAEPDRDWRIVLNGPLRGATFQRKGKERWVLIEKNNGFA